MANQFLKRFDLKIVLLGSSKSGKTALLHQYITHDYREGLPSTYDTAFAAKKVTLEGGRSAALAIWDTAGSPQFAHLSRMFIRGADVVLVCFDVTSRDNWERLKIWVHEARTRQRGCHIYLVCTKIDCVQQLEGQQRPRSSESEASGSPTASASPLTSAQELQVGAHSRESSRAASPEGQPPAQPSSAAGEGEGDHGGQTPEGSWQQQLQPLPASAASPTQSCLVSRSVQGSPRQPCRCHSPSPEASSVGASGGLAGASGEQGHEHGQHGEHAGAAVQHTVTWEGVASGEEWEHATRASSRPQSVQFEEPGGQAQGAGGTDSIALPAVPDEEVYTFCETIGARVFRVSAKTGEGVSEMFQSVAEECCTHPQPAPAVLSKPHKPAQSWSWRGRQGTPDSASGPPTPVTPLREPGHPTSFPATERYSIDSISDVVESGRRPGITHSAEWAGPGAGVAAWPLQQPQQPQQPQPQYPQTLLGKVGGGGGSGGGGRASGGGGGWRRRHAQPQPGGQEYVLDRSSFGHGAAWPGQEQRVGRHQVDVEDYEESTPVGMPNMDYNAKGSCKIT